MMSSELFNLTGKSAIVTGGGTGLGFQIATGLAEAGADVAICGRDGQRCRDSAARIEATSGTRALALECDVRDQDAIEGALDEASGTLGNLDILVNNAGTSWGAPVLDFPRDGWNKVIDVNLSGLFFFTQAFGRRLITSSRPGKIINLSSVTALRGAPSSQLDAVAYNASKGGVISLTRDLAAKWAPERINVNAVAPGWFPTDMSQVVLERSGSAYLDHIPLNRFGGEDDLKGVAIFLASAASDYLTGQTIVVDGGLSIT